MLDNKRPQIEINLPNNIIVRKKYDKLEFKQNNQNNNEYEYILKDKLVLPNCNALSLQSEDSDDTSNYTLRLDSEKIKLPLIVRSRKIGDKMIIKNMKNSKKIKEIFIENKINNSERNVWPIVCDNNGQIIWLPGLKKSNLDVKKGDKYDIIIKYILKGEE